MKDLSKYLQPQGQKGLAAVKAKMLGVAELEIENNKQISHAPISQWVQEGESLQSSPRQRHDSEDSQSDGVQLDEDGDIEIPVETGDAPKKPTTVFRDDTGKIVDINTYKSREEQRRQENEDMLGKWGSGVVQKAEKRSLAQRFAEEAGKPFSRYEIERDADEELKKKSRFGDPLAAFSSKEKIRETETVFQGTNRFEIHPGRRWDGVNRSNGFEVRYMNALAEKKAKAPEEYREANLDM